MPTNSQSVSPKQIEWYLNKAKREADNTLYESMFFNTMQQLHRNKNRLRVLSFPAADWEWEQGLTKFIPSAKVDFTGLEREPEVFEKAKLNASTFPAPRAKFSMTDEPMDFASFARRPGKCKPFDIIYLDWMGTWSLEKKSDIMAVFDRGMLNVGGLLLLTTSMQRGYPDTIAELEDLSYGFPMAFFDARGSTKYADSPRVWGIPRWAQQYAEDSHNVVLQPRFVGIYYSRNGSAKQARPQQHTILLRTS